MGWDPLKAKLPDRAGTAHRAGRLRGPHCAEGKQRRILVLGMGASLSWTQPCPGAPSPDK